MRNNLTTLALGLGLGLSSVGCDTEVNFWKKAETMCAGDLLLAGMADPMSGRYRAPFSDRMRSCVDVDGDKKPDFIYVTDFPLLSMGDVNYKCIARGQTEWTYPEPSNVAVSFKPQGECGDILDSLTEEANRGE